MSVSGDMKNVRRNKRNIGAETPTPPDQAGCSERVVWGMLGSGINLLISSLGL